MVGHLGPEGVELIGAAAACARCHGPRGKGTGEGGAAAPNIQASRLFAPVSLSEPGMGQWERPAYNDRSLAEALRRGVSSSGRTLGPVMPRFELPERDLADLLAYLPEANRLVADVDAVALESAGVPTTTALVSEARKRTIAPTKAVAPRSKRLRKARMPKELDPNKKIDAERWLPMRDRTYYRPKGRKGKKRAEGLTQGGPVAEEKRGGEVKKEGKKQVKKGKGKK